jgi:hypothetical protein
MKKSESATVRAEVLPMKVRTTSLEQAEQMLDEIVQRKVAEALGGDSSILQPFMQTRAVRNQIRKNQNVIENKKFALYFADWGCLVCGDKNSAHCGLAMCPRCYRCATSRMTSTLRKANAERQPDDGQALDLVEIAQKSVLRSLKALIPGGDK